MIDTVEDAEAKEEKEKEEDEEPESFEDLLIAGKEIMAIVA